MKLMNVYRVKTGSILPLGKQGENLARKIQFDISRWIGTLGPGTVQLLHQRNGDETPYPVAVEQEGNLAVWTVTNADTAAAGTGRAELQYYVGDALAKSETWMTKVLAALGPAGETPPEAQQGWVDQVLAQVARITGMTAQAVELPAGSAPTADYADGVLTIGIPMGGDVSEAQIAQAVAEYLSKNPIAETDPTVPDWAKQPEKPSYTADEVGALSSETLTEAITTALAQAKESGEFDGAAGQDGAPGQDGITPTIGANGNWYLGDTDTGKPSRGETGQAGADGRDGADGQPGADGKSAYQYAVEGGYTGTEESFAAKLAAEIPTVDSTLTKSGHAADAAAVGEQLSNLSEEIANLQTSGLTTEQVNALDGMFKVCAFTKADVSAEYTEFKTAFGITDSGGETELTLTSISATYDGGDVSVGTALSDLTGIVVTAHYSDGSSATVTGYTLDGTIAEGENTVTVIYGGKMTEFVVVGVAESGGEVVMLKSITGDGASWIDTEVLPETTHRYEISATLTGVTPEYFVGCDMSNVYSSYGGFYVNTHNSVAFSGCLNKNKFTGVGTWNTTEANLLTNKQAYFVIKDGLQAVYLDADYTIQQSSVSNGTTVWGANDGTEVPIIPIYLFRLNYTSQTHPSVTANYTPTATKIFWFKIYEDSTDELFHEFLPANKGGKIGMYDTVTGKFHENIGTGTFSYEEVAT